MSKEKISLTFLIPTYKNLSLLEKNLPSVWQEAQDGDTILISEDGVDDEQSLDFFRSKYRLTRQPQGANYGQLWQAQVNRKGKKITFAFYQRRDNGRFARNVNQAVELVKDDYFLLLNSDVALTAGVRKQLLDVMQKDTHVFAVTAKELDVNDDNKISGRNRLWWSKGRFWHCRDERVNEYGKTAWACGGSSLYRTRVWRELGGFDCRYYPAYWEDIDISWQARQKGYQVIYQPKAVVLHAHETTNDTVFGQQKMAQMSWDNGTRFAWKNSNLVQKCQFVFWYAYWRAKQFPAWRWWLVIFLTALVTRLALLDMPHGLTVDEAAIAYNGYGIWTQRRDEWLNRLPVSFRSFGDYKAPLAIYVTGFFMRYGGREIWLVRLPFALAGVASIWMVMKLVDLLLQEKKPNHLVYGAIAGVLMTVSPWHWHFSHLGFENNWALLFVVSGAYFLLKNLKQATDRCGITWDKKWWSPDLLLAGVSWVLALYSYHSSKIVVPLLLLATLLLVGGKLARRWRSLIVAVLISALLLVPLIRDSFWGEGLTRAGSSFLLDVDMTVMEKVQLLGENMMAYFAPAYLWQGQLMSSEIWRGEIAPNVRHGDGVSGVLTISGALMLLVLIVSLIVKKDFRRDYGRLVSLGVVWIIVATLPAAVTRQIPHSNQALLAIVGWIWLMILGLISWRYWWSAHIKFYRDWVVLWLVVVMVESGQWWLVYQRMFTNQTCVSDVVTNADVRVGEMRNFAVDYLFARDLLDALRIADGEKNKLKQIIVATGMEHEYIYALLASGIKPESYQGGRLSEKYLFLPEANEGEYAKDDVLILTTLHNDDSYERYQHRCEKTMSFYDNSCQQNLILCWTKSEE